MPDTNLVARGLARALPRTLLGRLTVVMLAGVMFTQLLGNLIWDAQLRVSAEKEVKIGSQYLAHGAANTAQFFMSLPSNYRPIIIQQFRKMGGTRFFVTLNRAAVPLHEIEPVPLTKLAQQQVQSVLHEDLPNLTNTHIAFAWPDQLITSEDGTKLVDLPENWVQHILLTKPNPAPVMVIQTEMEPGHWLYMASLMPNPYFLDNINAFTADRLMLQGLSLAAVLLLSILVVRWTTRPLAALAEAASAFGTGEPMPDLPETGSREFVKTVRAFTAMRERIQRYLEDRERLFVSISHDLRTPIMRLKLRAELLDDDDLRAEFHDDLDDLDMMVKGALQCVKDSDIHENPTELRLDALISRLVRGAQLAGHKITYEQSGISVVAKPLALKRAIGNLIDNGIHYGGEVTVSVAENTDTVQILIRDYGPGVPESSLGTLFEPYVRLEHGRNQNASGMGLGLGIARDIANAHGGSLTLENHPLGGLVATISLPRSKHDPID